jgi:hypothetical protein
LKKVEASLSVHSFFVTYIGNTLQFLVLSKLNMMLERNSIVLIVALLGSVRAFAPVTTHSNARRYTGSKAVVGQRTPLFVVNSVENQDEFAVMEDDTVDEDVNVDDDADTEAIFEVSLPVSKARPEFAALSPGSPVEIQIGNLDLARKAWKKRRRSGSPLLIPCSILTTDRKSMVVNNLIFLLHKFGKPISEQDMPERPGGYKSNHIAIPFPDLSRWYKSHLRASLAKHATSLGYETAAELVKDVISPQIEEEDGVKLWTVGKHSWLVARISKMRGHRLSAQSAMLQFREGEDDVMLHTGKTRIKSDDGPGSFDLEPVSAALRVSQRALDAGLVSTGSTHRGTLVGVDPMGDGGSPLLKVSLNLPNEISKRKRVRNMAPVDGKPIEHELNQLKGGDGPFIGKVVRVSARSGAAFIDIGAGRSVKRRESGGDGLTRVLGMLRFDDLVDDLSTSAAESLLEAEEEDEVDLREEALNAMEYEDESEEDEGEEMTSDEISSDFSVDDLFDDDSSASDEEEGEEVIEDISHLVSLEDGVYSFSDPESGEKVRMGSLRNDVIGTIEGDDEEDDFFAGLSPEQRFEKLGELLDDDEDEGSDTLQVGDEIDVYIQAVSKQSGRFMVTTRSSVQSMKVVKKESKANKNLDRLLSKFGDDINNILNLAGEEGEGVVKAISQTGDWVYVQPNFQDLPVGVAQIAENVEAASISVGDSVQVRLDGVDESRGQLALTVIAKA